MHQTGFADFSFYMHGTLLDCTVQYVQSIHNKDMKQGCPEFHSGKIK